MTEAVIRRAAAADAGTLSALGAGTFSETFAHLYPPEDLSAFLSEAYGLERTRRYLEDAGCATWLIEEDGVAIGYALAGGCALPHPDVTPACGELKRIYVLKSRQGGGRGSRLLMTALDWLKTEKTGALWIGVWSQNFGAQRLYERMGFEKVGEYGFHVGRTVDREFILRRG